MNRNGNFDLDELAYDVIDAAAASVPSRNLTFDQAFNIVLRNKELRKEGAWEAQKNRERKRVEINLCWQQYEMEG